MMSIFALENIELQHVELQPSLCLIIVCMPQTVSRPWRYDLVDIM
jgi:hypothetical protein